MTDIIPLILQSIGIENAKDREVIKKAVNDLKMNNEKKQKLDEKERKELAKLLKEQEKQKEKAVKTQKKQEVKSLKEQKQADKSQKTPKK